MQKSYSRVFLNSMINDKGLKIELFENRHIKITSNNTYAYYSFASNYDGLAVDTWYGLFINFSNIFRQITVNVWKMEWNSSTNLPATTNLTLILNKMQNMMPLDRTSCTGYFLEPSLMDLTNVRLFNRVVETEKQMLVLNQNIVKDAHNALIIDNAIPQSHLPYVGYTR